MPKENACRQRQSNLLKTLNIKCTARTKKLRNSPRRFHHRLQRLKSLNPRPSQKRQNLNLRSNQKRNRR